MKYFLLALLVICGLDEAFDQGKGVTIVWHLIKGIAEGVIDDVRGSVYRQ